MGAGQKAGFDCHLKPFICAVQFTLPDSPATSVGQVRLGPWRRFSAFLPALQGVALHHFR